MKVLLTVDTELSPGRPIGSPAQLQANVQGSFYGTPQGECGLHFQLELLREHGLNAVFFVEALSPIATGMKPLRDVVDLIRSHGQEVQLHAHTEWLALADSNPLGERTGQNMWDFSEDEQTEILHLARSNLEACGVESISAFRAGNYGADNQTLRALARNGIKFDSSYNYPYVGGSCRIETPEILTQPARIEEIEEIPVTFFKDGLGHFRHAQLCACSFPEMSAMLMQAQARGMSTFVIVSHSFELLSRSRQRVNKIVTARFEKLCRFLDKHRNRFETVGFNALKCNPEQKLPPPLESSPRRTLGRYAGQLVSRLYE